jgi:hypothetical protein
MPDKNELGEAKTKLAPLQSYVCSGSSATLTTAQLISTNLNVKKRESGRPQADPQRSFLVHINASFMAKFMRLAKAINNGENTHARN